MCPRAVHRLTRVSQRIHLTSVVSFCSRAYVRQKPPKPDASLRPLSQCPLFTAGGFPPACLCGHVNRVFTVQYALGSLPHWVSRQLSFPSPSAPKRMTKPGFAATGPYTKHQQLGRRPSLGACGWRRDHPECLDQSAPRDARLRKDDQLRFAVYGWLNSTRSTHEPLRPYESLCCISLTSALRVHKGRNKTAHEPHSVRGPWGSPQWP